MVSWGSIGRGTHPIQMATLVCGKILNQQNNLYKRHQELIKKQYEWVFKRLFSGISTL
jgi:hypothetical protein